MRPEDLPIHMKIITAGIAGCTADVASYPLDTVKVWQQINGEKASSSIAKSTPTVKKSHKVNITSATITKNATRTIVSKASKSATLPLKQSSRNAFTTLSLPRSGIAMPRFQPKSNGIAQTMLKVVRAHGVKGLYSGLPAGLQRQLGFCSVRIGLYDTIKGFYLQQFPVNDPNSKLIGHSVLAGCTTGLVAVGIFQPTEVVKIRMQASGGKGTFDAYRKLFRTGITSGWQGYETNCARMMIVNVCEIVTYDIVKTSIIRHNLMQDRLPCHLTSALISGFITTLVASPIDVVKTRFTNAKAGRYSNPIQCAGQMLAKEGAKAFYKGFLPSYLRIGTWNVLMFVGFEQYKRLCCKGYHRLESELPVHHEHVSYYQNAMFQSLLESGPIA